MPPPTSGRANAKAQSSDRNTVPVSRQNRLQPSAISGLCLQSAIPSPSHFLLCLPHSFLEKMAIPIINGYPYYRIRCHVQKFLFPIPPIIQINLCALYVDPQNLLYIQFERIALDFRELSVFRIDDDIFQSIGRLFFRIAYRTVLRHASLRQSFVFGIYVERFGICN